MSILQYKRQQLRTANTVQLSVLKHQHEHQYLDPSALRLSGKTATALIDVSLKLLYEAVLIRY